ncbi:DUF1150 domain-containing protein [Microvirga sp. W0021]|uniref:DUF1150 domain-containing protein n=1 Tax=Hohaiivirga grylli TaxID=3133970 RepID=A0ABV0BJU3_9HYPH
MDYCEFKNLDPGEFEVLGEGAIAYVKQMRSEEITKAFPLIKSLEPGMKFYALLSASGQPILLADSETAAVANAWEQELMTVSLQ